MVGVLKQPIHNLVYTQSRGTGINKMPKTSIMFP